MVNRLFLFSLLSLLSLSAYAQTFSVMGVIMNSSTKETIPICNVYFSGSSIGTMSDADGNFIIKGVKPGSYDLIVSHINYDFRSFPITIDSKDIDLKNILLKEKPVETSYAEVKDKVDRKWRRQFSRFKQFTLGKHFKEKDIQIPNAYVAEFLEVGGTLVKKEPFALEIDNAYTGYNIFYPVEELLLGQGIEQFMVGFPRFTPMESNDPTEKAKWAANRKRSYEGSIRHVFKSLIDRALEDNLFECFVTNNDPLDPYGAGDTEYQYRKRLSDWDMPGFMVVEETKDSRIKKVIWNDFLEVQYLKESGKNGQNQLTYLKANEGHVFVYNNGILVDPTSVTAYGYLSTEGLYEMLPFDYELDDSGTAKFKQNSSNTENPIEALTTNLTDFISDFPQEKVYLHLAKPYYATGETIWYKAYTVAGPNHIPTPLSQNLHVQLFDSNDKLVSAQTLYMERGLASGDLIIPDSLSAGDYSIRAFTTWMRNFDEQFFYNTKIKVIDPLSLSIGEEEKLIEEKLKFYPESGDLIQGVLSRVAFEILSPQGNLSGKLFDNNDNVLAEITAKHQGIGTFHFTPEAGKSYYVKLDGTDTRFELPKAVKEGWSMSINPESDEQLIVIDIKSNATENQKSEGYIVAHTRGLIGFSSRIEWDGPNTRLEIPKYNLRDGVIHLTLFNEDWKPEAERLIFKRPDNAKIDLRLTSDEPTYKLRDSTIVKLRITDDKGIPLKGYFSLSAFDTKQISASTYQENIASSLLLNSEVDGGVYNSIQYFDTKDTLISEKIDLVMMTKGWSKFLWKDIISGDFPEMKFEEGRGFSVIGKAISEKKNRPEVGAKVRHIGTFQGAPTFAESTTDENGIFRFDGIKYNEDGSFLQLQERKSKSKSRMQIDSVIGSSPDIPYYSPTITHGSNGHSNEAQLKGLEAFTRRSKERISIDSVYDFDRVTDLGTVVVEGSKVDRPVADINRGQIFGRGEVSLDASKIMENGQKFANALFMLQGRVPGLTITLSGEAGEPVLSLNRKNERGPDYPLPETIYFLDDIPVTIAAITSLPAERVARIEVLKGMQAFRIYGEIGNGGVISIYTKTDDEYRKFNQKLFERLNATDLSTAILNTGYYINREFYQPNYGLTLPEHIRPDYRDLIHWEPMIQTDEFGEALITFFNADLPTTVRVNLEGITEAGTPLSRHISYTVTKK